MIVAAALMSLLAVSPPLSSHDLPAPSPKDLAASVTTYDVKGSVTVLKKEEKVGDQTVVTIGSDVLFDFGSSALTPDATAKIKDVAGRIGTGGRPVAVVGYTDSIGDDATNLSLSLRRAKAVAAVLRAGTSPGAQVTTDGRGEKDPAAPNEVGGEDSSEGRAKNRRVSISFTAP